jgi:predicted TPR repeat methyltransferase
MKQPLWRPADGPRVPDGIDRALSLHRAGKLTQAGRLYQRILAANRNHVVALHYLGVLHHQTGQSERGIASIERALAIAPDYADAHNNLGNILKETNRLEPAFQAYQRVVELMPSHADAWNNLGVMLRAQLRHDEAESAFARAIQLNPGHAAAWQNTGNLLAALKRFDEAVAAYRRVLQLLPRHVAAYDALGRTLYRAGRIDEAVAVYREWLQGDPRSSVARHMLAACTGQAAPVRASDEYVRDTFDAFAASFDQVLDGLGYRAPALIGEALDRVLPARDASLAVADAGCGTGLCADFLRPRAKRLAGVDLSAGMLSRARARKQYDQLVEAELSGWLAAQRQAWDLIVSADTLCYFGPLDAVFSGAARALKPGGWLIFTVEQAAEGVDPYLLNPNGRYSHSERYVRDRLAESGLMALAVEPVVLRREIGHEVSGLLVTASR